MSRNNIFDAKQFGGTRWDDGLGHVRQTLTANINLSYGNSNAFSFIASGGDRIVGLPMFKNGKYFIISNVGVVNNVIVQNALGSVLVTLAPSQNALLLSSSLEWTVLSSVRAPLIIIPPANTVVKGFGVFQNFHGTGDGSVPANNVTVYDTGVQTTFNPVQGPGMDTTGWEGFQNVSALATNLICDSGSTSTGARFSLLSQTFVNTPGAPTQPFPFYVGGGFITYINTDDGGTALAPRGITEGIVACAWVSGPIHWHLATCGEFASGIHAGSVVDAKVGVLIDTTASDAVQGTTWDSGILFSNAGTAKWKALITSGNFAGQNPIASNGAFLKTQGAQTFQDGVDFSSATLTGNVIKSQHFNVKGSGQTTIQMDADALLTHLYVNQTDGATSTFGNAAGAFSSDTASAVIAAHGSARTTVRHGQVSGGWVEIGAYSLGGAGANGLLIGTITNKPVLFGVNDAAVGRWIASGIIVGGTPVAHGANANNVIGIANGVAPTTSPTGMGQLYVEAGALKFRGSGGTVTTIGAA